MHFWSFFKDCTNCFINIDINASVTFQFSNILGFLLSSGHFDEILQLTLYVFYL